MSPHKHLGGRDNVVVAIVQRPPVFMDKTATTDVACDAIIEAGREGAELIAFSEAWLAGYPFWTEGWQTKIDAWAQTRELFYDNAVVVPSCETDRLCAAAREADAHVVIGLNEMDERPAAGTVYNSLLFIDRAGKVLGTHRKLQPTFQERTFWGQGGPRHLEVFETDIGRIGGLVCAENFMTLAKSAVQLQGQDFHVAVWPSAFSFEVAVNAPEPAATRGTSIVHTAGRQYAVEANAFVLNGVGIYPKSCVPPDFPNRESLYLFGEGGSSIFGPTGEAIAGPTYEKETVYADCDARSIKLAKAILDCVGHYSRPDALRLEILAPNHKSVVRASADNIRRLSRHRIDEVAHRHDVETGTLRSTVEELADLGPDDVDMLGSGSL